MDTYQKLLNQEMIKYGENENDIIFMNISTSEFEKSFSCINQTGSDNERPPLLAWTKDRVYFSHEYDGEIEVYSVPRNPSQVIPHGHIGEYKADQFDTTIDQYYKRIESRNKRLEQSKLLVQKEESKTFLRVNAPTQKQGRGFTDEGWFEFNKANFYNRLTDDYDSKPMIVIATKKDENHILHHVDIIAFWDKETNKPLFGIVYKLNSLGVFSQNDAKKVVVKLGVSKDWVYPV